MSNTDETVEISWHLVHRKIKKWFIATRTKELKLNYHNLYKMYQHLNPTMTISKGSDGRQSISIPEEDEKIITEILTKISEAK